MQAPYEVVILASGPISDETIARLDRLIRRINLAAAVRVCGLLYELPRHKTLRERVRNFFFRLPEPLFLQYVALRCWRGLASCGAIVGARTLRLLHALRPLSSPGSSRSLEFVCDVLGCRLLVTDNMRGKHSREFVRSLGADLGILYGTRLLKPDLYDIPRDGSINLHKRKLPDYRGGGPVGLWELLDGASEIGVTVHRVAEDLDAGDIVASASIPIEEFDTLTSLAMKADVLGDDLIVESLDHFANRTVVARKQTGDGKLFRAPLPHQMISYERKLRATRSQYDSPRGRPAYKLLLRSLIGLPWVFVRNWYWRLSGNFPITILYHHLVSDRRHRMGCSTDAFLRHVEYLMRYYRVVSVAEAVELMKTGRVTQPTVVMTVDDGYGDNFLSLRAIRARTGVPMTLFLSSDYMSSGREFSHDVEFNQRGFLPLTWAQVRQLATEGFEIGSHTCTHFDCGSRDIRRLGEEITGSKRALERELDTSITAFSFPFGYPTNMSDEAIAIARENYRYVCSAWGGTNSPVRGGQGIGMLNRCPHPNNLWEVELRLQMMLELSTSPNLTFNPALEARELVG